MSDEHQADYRRPLVQFSRVITMGHVLQVVAMVGAGLFFALRLEARIDLNDAALQHEVETRKLVDDSLFATVGRIDNGIANLNNKFDDLSRRVDGGKR
ncbi:MAG: hypothetical protein WCF16_11855 [Alphaproteobacteria bacterium]